MMKAVFMLMLNILSIYLILFIAFLILAGKFFRALIKITKGGKSDSNTCT